MSKLILVDAVNGQRAIADGKVVKGGKTFDLNLFRGKPELEVVLKAVSADRLLGTLPTMNYMGKNVQSVTLNIDNKMTGDIAFIGIYVETGLTPNYRMYLYATLIADKVKAKELSQRVLEGLRTGDGIPRDYPVLEICQPFNRRYSLALQAMASV